MRQVVEEREHLGRALAERGSGCMVTGKPLIAPTHEHESGLKWVGILWMCFD